MQKEGEAGSGMLDALLLVNRVKSRRPIGRGSMPGKAGVQRTAGDGRRTISNQTHRICLQWVQCTFFAPTVLRGKILREGWSIFFKVKPLAVVLRVSDGHLSSQNTRNLHNDPILWGSLVTDESKILSTFLGPINNGF